MYHYNSGGEKGFTIKQDLFIFIKDRSSKNKDHFE